MKKSWIAFLCIIFSLAGCQNTTPAPTTPPTQAELPDGLERVVVTGGADIIPEMLEALTGSNAEGQRKDEQGKMKSVLFEGVVLNEVLQEIVHSDIKGVVLIGEDGSKVSLSASQAKNEHYLLAIREDGKKMTGVCTLVRGESEQAKIVFRLVAMEIETQ